MRYVSLILALPLFLSACGGGEEVEDEAPVEEVPVELPPAPRAALDGCEPAVRTTDGALLRCQGLTLTVSDPRPDADATDMMVGIDEALRARHGDSYNGAMDPWRRRDVMVPGLSYKIGGSGMGAATARGRYLAVTATRGGKGVRLIHCLYGDAPDASQRCEQDADELAAGGIPPHLAPPPEAEAPQTAMSLIPRMVGKKLVMPPGCALQAAGRVSCDKVELIWQEVAAHEPRDYEDAFVQSARSSLKQRMEVTGTRAGKCTLWGEPATCERVDTKSEQLGRSVVWLAHGRVAGQRLVLMCAYQGQGATPEVCAQALKTR